MMSINYVDILNSKGFLLGYVLICKLNLQENTRLQYLHRMITKNFNRKLQLYYMEHIQRNCNSMVRCFVLQLPSICGTTIENILKEK